MDFIVLNQSKGKEKIGVVDDYLTAMKPFEKALKMDTNNNVNLNQFIEFLKENVCEWSKDEKNKLKTCLDKLKGKLGEIGINMNKNVYIIKTSGREEFNSAYTRENMIILPQKKINYDIDRLYGLLAHEFFHVYSRLNEIKRAKLYKLLDFDIINSIDIPTDVKAYTLVNPDAMATVSVKVKYNNSQVKVCPLIMIKGKNIDVNKDISKSLRIRLYIIDSGEVVDAQNVSGYIEKVSINTDDIQHPEETLAENFTLILTKYNIAENKELLEGMLKIMREPDER
ncbi:hypothetical protein PV797_01745 [Clostridiaceae bacterium M8S5]|nr:hypothetical protein PV797_01745 [Clostridiaceae bacterium M8S5]